jgi:hypothetical protein
MFFNQIVISVCQKKSYFQVLFEVKIWLQLAHRSSRQYFTIMMIWSMLSMYKQQHLKVVNTPTNVKTCAIFICETGITRICFAKKSTFKNWLSCICHQVSGFAHVDEEIDSLFNIDNFPMINA